MRAVGSVWLRRLAIAALMAVALGYVPYHLYGASGLARYLKLQRQRDALHADNLKLLEANQQLRAQLDALGDEQGNLSAVAVERAARDELCMVKPGEVVYQLNEPPAGARP